MQNRNPKWWTKEHDSSWENVKTAFRRDWEQTKHDFGSDKAADLQQSAVDTVKQAAGKEPAIRNFDSAEPAFKYAQGAKAQYHGEVWNDEFEKKLSADYPGDWKSDRDYVRHGYNYGDKPRSQH